MSVAVAFGAGHVQGFTLTNSSTHPLAGVYSNEQSNGSLFVAGAGNAVTALVPTYSVHPTGVSVIGKYVVYSGKNDLRFNEVDRATSPQNLVFHPFVDESNPPSFRGGGGLGIAKLNSGKYLLVENVYGGNYARRSWKRDDNGVLVEFVSEADTRADRPTRFWELTGSLANPKDLVSNFLGTWNVSLDHPLAQRRFSENLSVITECRTGALYVVGVTGNNQSQELDRAGNPLPDDGGYFMLSRVLPNATGNGDLTLSPIKAYRKTEDRVTCTLRAAGGVFVTAQHKLKLYCSGYKVENRTRPGAGFATFSQ